MVDIPKDLGKNADRSYDAAPTVHPDAVSGSGNLRLKDGEIITHLRDGKVVDAWIPVTRQLPPPHETVLVLDGTNGDIYQARVCFGMHAPWWCGHNKLNFGVIFEDKGIKITHWRPLPL